MVRRLAGLRHRPAEEFIRQVEIAAPGAEVRVLDPGGSTSYP
jgi:DNA topoisomerase VI subunit B